MARGRSGDAGLDAKADVPELRRVLLTDITLDARCQLRVSLSVDAITEFRAAYESGASLPPLEVVYGEDGEFFLVDGWHRYEAARQAGLEEIDALVHSGGIRDAILHAARANHQHGVRRSNEDKRKAVATLLADQEWQAKADRWIAETCGTGHHFVAKVRSELATQAPQNQLGARPVEHVVDEDAAHKRLGRDGRSRRVSSGKPKGDGQNGKPRRDADGRIVPPGGVSFDPSTWEEPEGPEEQVHEPPAVDALKIQRSKTVKTAEALMRAFDDLHELAARPMHDEAIRGCKRLLKLAEEWT